MLADYDDSVETNVFDVGSWQRTLMESADDQGFCDLLFQMLRTSDPGEDSFESVFTPWILQRIRLMRDRAPHIWVGGLLTKLRRLYPGRIFPAELLEAMRGAESLQDGSFGDVAVDKLRQDVLYLRRHGAPPGIHPGWTNVALHYTPKPGHMTIVTGIASHMKSTWVQALCINIAKAKQWRFGIFSPENYPPDEFLLELVTQVTGTPEHQLPDEVLHDTTEWLLDHFHCIDPPDEVPPSLDYLLAVARVQVKRYHIQGLVFDPWNRIDHQFGYRQNETQYVSDALSKIQRFAAHHQVHAWVVAHPTKLKKAESGPYQGLFPPPTPYDINGSAHFYNKADYCLSIWRDALHDSPTIEVHVQKVRRRRYGRPGMVELTYHHGLFLEETQEGTTPHWTDRK